LKLKNAIMREKKLLFLNYSKPRRREEREERKLEDGFVLNNPTLELGFERACAT